MINFDSENLKVITVYRKTENGEYDFTTIYKLTGAEEEGLIRSGSARRLIFNTSNPIDLDFILDDDPNYTYVDIKQPVSSLILKKQGQIRTFQQQAERVGKGIIKQKRFWSKPENRKGAEKPEKILHVVDLAFVHPDEKAQFKKVLENTVHKIEPDFMTHIKFINDKNL